MDVQHDDRRTDGETDQDHCEQKVFAKERNC